VFGSGSRAGAVARAVVPRRAPRLLGAGLLAGGASAAVSLGAAVVGSVPELAVSAGASGLVEPGVRLLPRAGRRVRVFRALFEVSGVVAAGDSAGVGSGNGAAATSGSGGYSMRAPVEETRLPFFLELVPGDAGCAVLFSFSASNGPPAIDSNAPPK
jgi:hypothetical protein